jgi:hypothetical protein
MQSLDPPALGGALNGASESGPRIIDNAGFHALPSPIHPSTRVFFQVSTKPDYWKTFSSDIAMIQSRSQFFLHAKVTRAESDGQAFNDAKAGRPVERRLNRIERVAASHHALFVLRVDKGMRFTFDSADSAVLSACEMQHRCAVLPQISSLKLALRIGIHQGTIRQRSQDVVDNAPEIANQLARIDDGVLISQDTFNNLGEDLRRFARPFEETVADTGAFAVDWREILPGTNAGEPPPPSPSPERSARTGPCLQLQLGLRTMELSEQNPIATFGRDPASDFVLTDIHASRNHCRIEFSAKDILLTDSSTNGTMVVTENKQEILVKNGSFTLTGKGMIFFGRPFMGERRGGIRYESR